MRVECEISMFFFFFSESGVTQRGKKEVIRAVALRRIVQVT